MTIDLILFYILLCIGLEVYEVQWQKASTLMGMLSRMYAYYAKSIFLFLIMHPSLYFSIYLMMITDYNLYAVIYFTIKAADIFTKLYLMKQVFIDEEVNAEMKMMLSMPLDKYLPYIGVLAYPPLVFMALS